MTNPVSDFERLSTKDRRAVTLVAYVCASQRGCALLTVWQAPNGRNWYTPRYVLSEEIAKIETAESARSKRTEDGQKRWRAMGGSLDELIEFTRDAITLDERGIGRDASTTVGLSVNCRHLRNLFVSAREIAGDLATVMPGSRTRIILPRTHPDT
jgi:hypothetical protein